MVGLQSDAFLLSYSFVLPSASHPCLLSRLLLALNARSCGVKLWQMIGKGLHFEIDGIFPALTLSDLFTVAFSSGAVSLLHVKWE